MNALSSLAAAVGSWAAALAIVFASCPGGGGGAPPPADPPAATCELVNATASADGIVLASRPVEDCYITVLAPGAERLPRLLAPAEARGLEPLPLIGGYRSTMPPRSARGLARTAGVTVYECETITTPDPAEAAVTPGGIEPWGLDRLDQRALPLDGQYRPAPRGLTGHGAHVIINDTGRPLQLGGFAHVGECYSATGGSCSDDNDHGSHVGGTIAHRDYGVAPGATVHWCKSLLGGSGSDADVIECIDWAVTLCEANDWPCVGNMSLGGAPSAPLDLAVCASHARGVPWAVAAGNENEAACSSSPSRVAPALTVGATRQDDRRAAFSNHGECVDLFAPGEAVWSIDRRGLAKRLSGTSMASPHVAGVAALCIGAGRTGADLIDCVLSAATRGAVSDPAGAPNLLAYAGEGLATEAPAGLLGAGK